MSNRKELCSKRDTAIAYNKFLIPILLGVIVFINSELDDLLGVYLKEVLVNRVIFNASAMLFGVIMLLFYASAPKNDLVFKLVKRINLAKSTDYEQWEKISLKIDIIISQVVWSFLLLYLLYSGVVAYLMN